MLMVYATIEGKRVHGKALQERDGEVLVLSDDGKTQWVNASSVEAIGGGTGAD